MALSDVHWKGLDAVITMTKILPTKIANQKMRSAFRFALEPTRQQMRALIPQRTGRLWYATDITINTGRQLKDFVGIVGPRRRKGSWNQQGWHAHLVEAGTKKHTITAKNVEAMPLFKARKFFGFAKEIEVEGSRGTKPFSRSIDSTWEDVAKRVADKTSEIMVEEIKSIQSKYGNVASK